MKFSFSSREKHHVGSIPKLASVTSRWQRYNPHTVSESSKCWRRSLTLTNSRGRKKRKVDSWFVTPSQPWRLYQGDGRSKTSLVVLFIGQRLRRNWNTARMVLKTRQKTNTWIWSMFHYRTTLVGHLGSVQTTRIRRKRIGTKSHVPGFLSHFC